MTLAEIVSIICGIIVIGTAFIRILVKITLLTKSIEDIKEKQKNLEETIDRKIESSPSVQNYKLTKQTVDERLMPDNKENKKAIGNIKVKLGIYNGE